MASAYRDIPSVEALLQDAVIRSLQDEYGHALTVEALRDCLDRIRVRSSAQALVGAGKAEIHAFVKNWLQERTDVSLRAVINASGVILHTNLGRAPLSADAIRAMRAIAGTYSNLEYDLTAGKRGKRADAIEQKLIHLTGAEAAFVVNNNASAVLLVLAALARRKRVVISRTQLVEIGGGFRVPEVLQQSGAKLYEIGTTNRVHLQDYETALDVPNALILRAHHSNFKIIGFSTEPSLEELVSLAAKTGHLVIDDLGSGAVLPTETYVGTHEPTVQESIKAGADVVCFSGDKLFGGPQAGILVGKAAALQKIKKHPFARAVRADKLCLAGLEATVAHYLKGEAERKIPVWQMLSMPLTVCDQRAYQWQQILGQGRVIDGMSTIGGGSLPEETLPTRLLAIPLEKADVMMKWLRELSIPIIARVVQDQVVFDPRTIFPEQDELFLNQLESVLKRVKP